MAKLKTLSEAETARRRAVTGLHNLGMDEDADRIDSLTAAEYADEKGFQIAENPRRNYTMARNRSDLQAQLEALKAENEDLQETVDDLQGQLDDISDIVNPSDADDSDDDDSGSDDEDDDLD